MRAARATTAADVPKTHTHTNTHSDSLIYLLTHTNTDRLTGMTRLHRTEQKYEI